MRHLARALEARRRKRVQSQRTEAVFFVNTGTEEEPCYEEVMLPTVRHPLTKLRVKLVVEEEDPK